MAGIYFPAGANANTPQTKRGRFCVIARHEFYLMCCLVTLLANVINPVTPIWRDKVVVCQIVYIFDESETFICALCNGDIHQHLAEDQNASSVAVVRSAGSRFFVQRLMIFRQVVDGLSKRTVRYASFFIGIMEGWT